MNFIDKSLKLSYSLYPKYFEGTDRQYHFSFLWYKRKRLVAVGVNNPSQPSAKALYFANRYNLRKQKEYPYIHSEVEAIARVFGKFYIDERCTMVNIRINSLRELQNSRPCRDCEQLLTALNVSCVYSTTTGFKGA